VSTELAIGLAAGFVLGALAVLVFRVMAQRRRRPRDLGAALGLPVLGRVPAGALGAPGEAAGSGLSTAGLEAFRLLSSNLRRLDSAEPRAVLVTRTSARDEEAEVGLGLATASALSGRRTLLVECDLRHPTLAGRLGIAGRPGLAQYLRGEASPQEVLQIVSLASPEPGSLVGAAGERELICIAGGGPAADSAELLASDRFREFVGMVSGVYGTVLLDAGGPDAGEVEGRELVPLVDAVVLCTAPGRPRREGVDRARALIGQPPDRPAGVAVSGGDSRI